ncbi:MAG: DNA primase [Spirochaetes bacterium]|nr:DNA primase [Spirochaetota bacterium]
MKRIPDSLIQDIIQANDIVSVVGHYVRLQKQGSRWIGLCPFHNEKTPSFGVQADKGFFYCFGCKKGGDAVTFIKEMEHCQYIEAIERLAELAGIPIVYEGSDNPAELREQKFKTAMYELYNRLVGTFHYFLVEDKRGQQALTYIRERAISLETIQRFKLGFVPEERGWLYDFLLKKAYSKDFLAKSGLFSSKYQEFSIFGGRLVFPIVDIRSRPVAFGGRTLKDSGPKYINSPETVIFRKSENLFGLDAALNAVRNGKKAIICEGYMDVLAFHEAGENTAVAPLGTAFTDNQAQLLKRYAETLVLCFDSDKAGIEATLRAFKVAEKQNLAISVLGTEGAKDPAEILQKFGSLQLKKMAESTITRNDYIIEHALKIASQGNRSEAFDFVFSNAAELSSEIQKDSLLESVAGAFNIDPYSVFADFKKYRHAPAQPLAKSENGAAILPIQANSVYSGFIAALVLNPEFFQLVRAEFSASDFELEDLKDVFIVMEELFRRDELTSSEIIPRLANPALRTFIHEKAASGDYSVNPDKVITDALFRLHYRKLETEKARLVSRIKSYDPVRDADEISLNDLLYEKMHLDGELARLKEEWHERN